MKMVIWGKDIDLDDKMLQEYKKLGNNIQPIGLRHLALTSGAKEESTATEIKKAIENGILETFELEKRMPTIIERIKRGDIN